MALKRGALNGTKPPRWSSSPCPSETLCTVDQTRLQVAWLCSRQNKSCWAPNLLLVPSQSAEGSAWLYFHGAVIKQSPEVKGLLKHILTPDFSVTGFAQKQQTIFFVKPRGGAGRSMLQFVAEKLWCHQTV